MPDKELIKQEIERLEVYPQSRGFIKHMIAFIDSLQEEPASEGLIEEIDKIWKTCNPIDEGMGVETANIHIEQFDDIARHFAEWQKNQMKETLQTEYEKGRFDMREEMMKDAVEGEITLDNNGDIRMDCADVFHVGDRVKIIIVKTEQ